MKTISQLIAVATIGLSVSVFAVPRHQEDPFFTQTTRLQPAMASDSSDRTPQGQMFAADGSDRTFGHRLA
ncbi:hypothetical protein [Pseudomonas sp. Irchel 3A7]|uniref:hypothetical protein n=1 Tax=Pseudomonas sp. Irchel 3A7 TaxID=2008913 RepID=UPI000BA41AC1|nr:hypothetical protein [Pseudomonas sp. Irchel 3A7]